MQKRQPANNNVLIDHTDYRQNGG